VPATGKPEVFPRHADPLEILRGGEHPLDQLPVLVLQPPSLDQRLPRLGDAIGEPVANRLQLAEVEDPRFGGDGGDAVGDLGVTEGFTEDSGQLSLQARDLPAQLLPRPALVDDDVQPTEFLLSEQSRH